ncbi:hypothetical protein DL771_001106 [Monosporascus sp. 5C6A]|nr:hypothetical protein DL771_001106 [Monosporascus sp. 5C6A]
MSASIADRVAQCLAAFKAVSSAAAGIDGGKDPTVQVISNEVSRLRLWAGNIGAHRRGRSSLDYRLRDASTLRVQVIRLLENLQDSLDDARAVLTGERIPWDQMPPDGDDSDEEPDEELEIEGLGFETELSQLSSNIAETIDCLLKLSMSIRNPASHDRYMAWKHTDTAFFNSADINHVLSKFRDIDEWLADRLGKAISRRRQYFRYRESHGQKMAQGLDFDSGQTEADAISTVASSIPLAMKDPTAGSKPVRLDEDDHSDTGLSQTSFAPTVADSGVRKIPPLPVQAEKGPFQCPFCHMLISVSSTLQWKIVLRQMKSMVDDTSGWTTCFANIGHHGDALIPVRYALEEVDLDALAESSEIVSTLNRDFQCPLCKETSDSIKLYQRHVGRHQAELALFALPDIEDGDEDGSEQNDDLIESDVSSHCSDNEQVAGNIKYYWASSSTERPAQVSESFQNQDGSIPERTLDDQEPEGGQEATDPDSESEFSKFSEGCRARFPDLTPQEIRGAFSFLKRTSLEARETIREQESSLDRRFQDEDPIEAPEKTKAEYKAHQRDRERGTSPRSLTLGSFSNIPSGPEQNLQEVSTLEPPRGRRREKVDKDAIEEYRKEDAERKLKERNEAGELEKEYKGTVEEQLLKHGLDEKEINGNLEDKPIPTYTRMARRHVSLETLRVYNIDYLIDEDPDYVLIKRWVPEEEQDTSLKDDMKVPTVEEPS